MSFDASQLTLGVAIVLSLGTFVWFLVLAFPRRRGTTPYCRRCRYNLSGTAIDAADARCPECGAALSRRRALLRGERHYRRGLLILTATVCVLALLSAGLGIYALLIDSSWLLHAPTSLLLRLATSRGPLDPGGAFQELNRRLQNGLLSAGELNQLGDVCLNEHGLPAAKAATAQLASDMLADLLGDGLLTDAQKGRLIDNLTPQAAALPNPLASGMNACITLTYPQRATANLPIFAQLQNRRLNGQPCAMAPGPSNWKLDKCAVPGRIEQVLLSPEDGDFEFSVEVAFRIGAATPDVEPLAVGVRTIRVPLSVRPGDPRALVRSLDTPELREQLVQTLRVLSIHPPSALDGPHELVLALSAPTPVRLVWTVSAVVDGTSIPLGLLRVPRGASGTIIHRFHADGPLPPTVSIVVAPDADAALDSIDHPDFYGGAFQFDGVSTRPETRFPVRSDQPRSP